MERHERAARALGATDAEWAAATQRMSHDVCATVDDQLAWLREAGFADAGCSWRDGRFAVLVAPRRDGLNSIIEGRECARAQAPAVVLGANCVGISVPVSAQQSDAVRAPGRSRSRPRAPTTAHSLPSMRQ